MEQSIALEDWAEINTEYENTEAIGNLELKGSRWVYHWNDSMSIHF